MNGIQLGVFKIEREFTAPINDVFAAFTQAKLMSQWFFAFPKGSARVKADLRVGGKYSIEMIPATEEDASNPSGCGGSALHLGEYLEIAEPDRLVFTWIKDGFVDHSIVTLDFHSTEIGTLVKLIHQVPADKIAPHTQGWNLCLDSLETFFG